MLRVAMTAKSSTVGPWQWSEGGQRSFVNTTYGKSQTKSPTVEVWAMCTLLCRRQYRPIRQCPWRSAKVPIRVPIPIWLCSRIATW